MKKNIVLLWLGVLAMGLTGLFWRIDWIYNLPTPVPKNYVNVASGEYISLASITGLQTKRPVLLHFFNPDCPCSKFNATHFRSLVKLYGSQVDFVIVPISKNHHTVKEIQAFYQLELPVLFDTSIAARCGVYSTPQAVIIDTDQKLYYRGNYNRSRYCTDKKSDYALMALDSLLQQIQHPVFNHFALTAYGCKIPGQ